MRTKRSWLCLLYTSIDGFIRKNGIDMRDYEKRDYESFNDFFTRRIRPGRRPFDADPRALIAPADARLSAYAVSYTHLKHKGKAACTYGC